MRFFSRQFVFAAAVLLIAQLAIGQGFQVGTISGIVKDETGGVLPGVTVTVTNVNRGTTRMEVTDANGRYRFASLPLGTYNVEAELSGFQAASRRGVLVQADSTSTADLTLRIAAEATEITVTAEAPIVDPTNATQTTRVNKDDFEKAPVVRNYQSIARLAPGVVGGANPNSSGALTANNQFLYDGIDATDPTTGTFGSNLNFEAIQEVQVLTNGVSAEYGRATGAIVSIITKSGTNEFEGSAKWLATNDDWNNQNKTKNQITGASLARTQNDMIDYRMSYTLGGPIVTDRAWFFGAYEEWNQKGAPQQQTVVTNENWSEARTLELANYRLSAQITPSHQVWVKYGEDPMFGINRGDYSGSNSDLYTVVSQGQGGEQKAIQYAGVFGSALSVEAMYAEATSQIFVGNYKAPGPFDNGSAVWDLNRNRYFNGLYFATGDNVSRPRDQINAAATYFLSLGNNTHDLKLGIDLQEYQSMAKYTYTNNRGYDLYFDPATYTFDRTKEGQLRYDYAVVPPQTSTGGVDSIYLRDKFTIGPRLHFEAGLRYEDQSGENDRGVTVVDSQVLSPRFAATYDLTGDSRTLLTATAGRFHDFLLQNFVDSYAQSAQRSIYDLYRWDVPSQAWVFLESVNPASGGVNPNTDLKPAYTDEITIGFQRQLGATMGAGVRFINREWDDLVDDFRRYENGRVEVDYENSDIARREYQALQFTFEKRFARNWSALANYTYSKAEGNHFGTTTSGVNNFRNATCRGVLDPTIGDIPCAEAERRLFGEASYDFTNFLNVIGTYGRSFGPVNTTLGFGGRYQSGPTYAKNTTVRVLDNGALTGQSLTYFYDGAGADRLDAYWQADLGLEATYNIWRDIELGARIDAFNVTDNQEQITVNATAWCNANTAACQTQRNNYGKATARGSFQAPREYRLTGVLRF